MAHGRAVLPPGDADRRRPDPPDRRPGRGRARVPEAELRTRRRRRRARRRRHRRRRRRGCSTPGWRTRPASGSTNVEHGEEIHLRAELEVERETSPGSASASCIANADGARRLRVRHLRSRPTDGAETGSAAGERVAGHGRSWRTRSPPGRYFVHCGVTSATAAAASTSTSTTPLDFVVFGTAGMPGHRLDRARDRSRRSSRRSRR